MEKEILPVLKKQVKARPGTRNFGGRGRRGGKRKDKSIIMNPDHNLSTTGYSANKKTVALGGEGKRTYDASILQRTMILYRVTTQPTSRERPVSGCSFLKKSRPLSPTAKKRKDLGDQGRRNSREGWLVGAASARGKGGTQKIQNWLKGVC